MFSVYILFSESLQRYYVGQTNNINDRLQRRNKVMVRSTKGGIPWVLIKIFETHSRQEAMALEMKIKKKRSKKVSFGN